MRQPWGFGFHEYRKTQAARPGQCVRPPVPASFTLRAILFRILFGLLLVPPATAFPQGSSSALPQLTPGIISTIAGKNYSGNSGYSGNGGPALSAEMYGPQSVALDASGNLYITDSNNQVIRVVNRQTTAITILGVTIQPGDIQTVAGVYPGALVGGSFGGDGGPAGKASFSIPYQIIFDTHGDLFIADTGNSRIRVINLQTTAITVFGVTIQPGDVDTVAGDAINGVNTICAAATDNAGDGCPATQAGLGIPEGIAFDAAGNLYIADYGPNRIRKVSATTNIITSVAGNGQINYTGDGGPATQAALFDPGAVELDAAGNIYISEMGSSRVRVVNTQTTAQTFYGVTIQPNDIDTVAGSGTAVANQPGSTAAGYSGDGGPANQAHLDTPEGILLDAVGNLYIADQSNSLIRKVDVVTGIITTIAGNFTDLGNSAGRSYSGDGGPATSAGIANPAYMTFDPQGNLLFAEYGNQVIRQITIGSSAVNFPDTFPGSESAAQIVTVQNVGKGTLTISGESLGGTDPGSFGYGTTCSSTLAAGASCTFSFTFAPTASGTVQATFTITESSPAATQTITLSGTGSSTTIAEITVSPTSLPFGNQTVGTTSAAKSITLSNTGTAPFTPSSTLPGFVALVGVNSGDFTETDNCGESLAAGDHCTINISFAPQAAVDARAFVAIEGDARNTPQLVALSGTGTESGVTTGSSPVLQVIPGVVTTVAGDGFDAGTMNTLGGYTGNGGPAVGAELSEPGGVAEDAAGNVYFADSKNNVIRFVNMQASPVTIAGITVEPGDIQTIVGNGFGAGLSEGGFSGDGGPALSAELHTPTFVTLDPSGNIYFADSDNHVLRMVNTQSSPINVNGVTVPANAIQTVVGQYQTTTVCAQATDAIGDGCPATSAVTHGDDQMAFDAAGNLYLGDACYDVLRTVNMGSSPTTIAGVPIQPGQIQIVAGTLNAADKCSGTSYGGDGGPALSAKFNGIVGVALDADGNIFVVDANNARIRAINTQSKSISIFGVTIAAGDVQTVAGSGNFGYSGDFGPATKATMTIASGIKLDRAGNLYFADTLNNVIRTVFVSNGIIRTVAGNGYGAIQVVNNKANPSTYTGGYSGDGGAATSAEFFGPFDLSIDSSGNSYVGDLANRVIRQVSATPAGFNFPDTQVGTTSAPEIYTFSNISNQAITFTGLTVSPDFKQVPSGLTDCTATISLPAGGICQLALAFAPTEAGPLTGTAQTTNTAGVQIIQLSGTGTTADDAVLQSIAVTPASPSIVKGSTQQFTATGIFSDGSTQNLTSSVTWKSLTTTVATIGTSSGLASGVSTGMSQITATLGTITSSPVTLTVTATAVTLQSIAVTPPSPSIVKGSTQQFTATGTYSDKSTKDITTSVTWASATLTVATFSTTTPGLATGVGTGMSNITATLGTVVSPADVLTVTAAAATLQSIAVTPPSPSIAKGSTQQFAATGTYSDKSTKDITSSVTWASKTLTVATFSTTTPGLATGVGTGMSNITARLGTVVSPADVLTVTAATVTLESIAVTPPSPSIAKGSTQQFTATGTYSDKSTKDITSSVTWASQTLTVATFSTTTPGLATGVGAGTSQITATLGSVVSPADVLTVTAATLVSIAVTPPSPTILIGGTQPFTATGTYSDHSTQNITTSVTWASATSTVATIVAGTGVATGVSAGTSQITAALGSITSPADTLTVNNPAPSITTLSPTHSPAGTGFTLTVNGSGFVSNSTVSFNGKTETTTFGSATQLTAAIPATDVPAGATVNVTVTNPAPGGGTSNAISFTIDDFSLTVPVPPVNVVPGQATPVTITITPTSLGFANPIQLSVAGLPKGTTGLLSMNPVTPGTATTNVTLTVTATAAGSLRPFPAGRHFPKGPWGLLAAILAVGLLVVRRRTVWGTLLPARAVLAMRLILAAGLGVSLSGCGGGFPLVTNATPAGNYTVTVTGTSGTVQHTASIMLSIE